MKRTIDKRSGVATAWIRRVDACRGLLPYAASLLLSVLWTPLAFARTAFDRIAVHSSGPVCTTFSDAAADHVGLRAFQSHRILAAGPSTAADATCVDPATVHPAKPVTASRPDGRKRRRTVDGGAASELKIERESECGMDRYRWSQDGDRPWSAPRPGWCWPRNSGMRPRPPVTDHEPDRPALQTAALAR